MGGAALGPDRFDRADPEPDLGSLGLVLEDTPVSPDELAHFYDVAGWHVVPAGNFRRALAGTYYSVAVRRDGRLVGYGRVVSDGGIHAWIHDVIVLPEMRGRGIGRTIMRKLMEKVSADGIPYIGLFAAQGRSNFYEDLGFKRRPDDRPGMYLYCLPE